MKLKLICISFVYCIACYGNVQHGYVKTIARENKPSQRVNLVAITLRDSQMVISDSTSLGEGTFSFETQDEYGFRSIRKSGYSVLDKDILAVTKHYTPTPVEILVYNIAEKEKEKQEYVENQTQVAFANYRKQIASLEQQLADHTKSEEEVRQERIALQETLDKYQNMIEDIAEYYSLLNYEDLDSVEIAIDKAMKAGDMEKAYRLIRKEININTIVADSRKEEADIAALSALIDRKDSVHRNNNEHRANLLYNYYVINFCRCQYDSAALCMILRAELDTNRVKWQLQAGSVECFFAHYDSAMSLYQRGLRRGLELYGENHHEVADAYNLIGVIYDYQGKYLDALGMFQKALNIRLNIFENNYIGVGISYSNIGNVYLNQEKYTQALEMYLKALMLMDTCETKYECLETVYNNMGTAYYELGNDIKALELYQKVLDNSINNHNEYSLSVATCYNQMSLIHIKQGNYRKAHEELHKALRIISNLTGTDTFLGAAIYNNIGLVYYELNNFVEAHSMFLKALNICEKIWNKNHLFEAKVYQNIGSVYEQFEDYQKALEYYQMSLNVMLSILEEYNSQVALLNNKIGCIYFVQGDYTQALLMFMKALDIQLAVSKDNYHDVAIYYTNIGLANEKLQKYSRALWMYHKALDVYVKEQDLSAILETKEKIKQLKSCK